MLRLVHELALSSQKLSWVNIHILELFRLYAHFLRNFLLPFDSHKLRRLCNFRFESVFKTSLLSPDVFLVF